MPKAQRISGVENRQRKARPRKDEIFKLVDHLLDAEGEDRGVSVVLLGVGTMRRLNRAWMGKDAVTDVLSFPAGPPIPGMPPEEARLGEVLICVPVCIEEADRRDVTLTDEIARMLIHGLLHLLGHDHATAAQRRKMYPREKRYLSWSRRHRLCLVTMQ